MSTEKPDPKNPAEPLKTTKLPDQETDIPDEELEKATGGGIPSTLASFIACTALCGAGGGDLKK